jgi:hypothetical protein
MKKILILLGVASGFGLAACSSVECSEMQGHASSHCHKVYAEIRSNKMAIKEASDSGDMSAVGMLKQKNHDIIKHNKECFSGLK